MSEGKRSSLDPRVAAFLAELQLVDYAPNFKTNDITFGMLLELTDAELQSIGVNSLGHRKLVQAGIEQRRAIEKAPRDSPIPPTKSRPIDGAPPLARPRLAPEASPRPSASFPRAPQASSQASKPVPSARAPFVEIEAGPVRIGGSHSKMWIVALVVGVASVIAYLIAHQMSLKQWEKESDRWERNIDIEQRRLERELQNYR